MLLGVIICLLSVILLGMDGRFVDSETYPKVRKEQKVEGIIKNEFFANSILHCSSTFTYIMLHAYMETANSIGFPYKMEKKNPFPRVILKRLLITLLNHTRFVIFDY